MKTLKTPLHAITTAAILGTALTLASFTSASAASRVVVIKIEPANEAVCMHEVEELRKGVEMANAAGTAAALADEAAEDCKAGKYAMAEETLNDGHRALNRHKMRGK